MSTWPIGDATGLISMRTVEYREMSDAGTAVRTVARPTGRPTTRADSTDPAHYGYAAPSLV